MSVYKRLGEQGRGDVFPGFLHISRKSFEMSGSIDGKREDGVKLGKGRYFQGE